MANQNSKPREIATVAARLGLLEQAAALPRTRFCGSVASRLRAAPRGHAGEEGLHGPQPRSSSRPPALGPSRGAEEPLALLGQRAVQATEPDLPALPASALKAAQRTPARCPAGKAHAFRPVSPIGSHDALPAADLGPSGEETRQALLHVRLVKRSPGPTRMPPNNAPCPARGAAFWRAYVSACAPRAPRLHA